MTSNVCSSCLSVSSCVEEIGGMDWVVDEYSNIPPPPAPLAPSGPGGPVGRPLPRPLVALIRYPFRGSTAPPNPPHHPTFLHSPAPFLRPRALLGARPLTLKLQPIPFIVQRCGSSTTECSDRYLFNIPPHRVPTLGRLPILFVVWCVADVLCPIFNAKCTKHLVVPSLPSACSAEFASPPPALSMVCLT